MIIRVISGRGRALLGEFDLAPNKRTPQMMLRTDDGLLSVCLASHQEGDVWYYRRVGVEREPDRG